MGTMVFVRGRSRLPMDDLDWSHWAALLVRVVDLVLGCLPVLADLVVLQVALALADPAEEVALVVRDHLAVQDDLAFLPVLVELVDLLVLAALECLVD